jgi:dTDP-4-dehydrorhamnose reductase
MNILVFGKNGQLGNAFQKLFGAMHLPGVNIRYVGRDQCDLSNSAALSHFLSQSKVDLMINTAAYTAVDKAETEVELAFAINAKAPELMARYAVEHDATFLHYSTDYVFDGSKKSIYVEGDLRNPLGIYGKSKAAGEEAIEKVFANSAHGQYAIFRTSWVYGDGNNFIRTILRLAKEREELKVINDQYGVPTSAEWLAQVSLNLVLDQQLNLRKLAPGIYHAVPAGETTWYGLARFAAQAAIDAGVILKVSPDAIKPISAVEYPLPAPRPMNSRMNIAKLQLALEHIGDMSKLQHCKQVWSDEVQAYVTKLAQDGLI